MLRSLLDLHVEIGLSGHEVTHLASKGQESEDSDIHAAPEIECAVISSQAPGKVGLVVYERLAGGQSCIPTADRAEWRNSGMGQEFQFQSWSYK
jgi:hypothetical protein